MIAYYCEQGNFSMEVGCAAVAAHKRQQALGTPIPWFALAASKICLWLAVCPHSMSQHKQGKIWRRFTNDQHTLMRDIHRSIA